MRARWLGLAALAAVVPGASGCGGTGVSGASEAAGNQLAIYSSLPLQGPSASISQQIVRFRSRTFHSGSRGDFLVADPNDGSLLVTQTDRILRLSGATVVPPVTQPIPEPAGLTLLAVGALCVLGYRRRVGHRSARSAGP